MMKFRGDLLFFSHGLYCIEIFHSFVEKFGTRYCIGSVVFCTIDDHTPVFGKIKDILVLPSNVYLH